MSTIATTGIYLITNKVNGMGYVGQSVNIERRIGKLFREAKTLNAPIYRAIRHFGKDNFDVRILEICSVDELSRCEAKWMTALNTIETGYNVIRHFNGGKSLAGRTYPGRTLTEEHKAKISAANTKRWV